MINTREDNIVNDLEAKAKKEAEAKLEHEIREAYKRPKKGMFVTDEFLENAISIAKGNLNQLTLKLSDIYHGTFVKPYPDLFNPLVPYSAQMREIYIDEEGFWDHMIHGYLHYLKNCKNLEILVIENSQQFFQDQDLYKQDENILGQFLGSLSFLRIFRFSSKNKGEYHEPTRRLLSGLVKNNSIENLNLEIDLLHQSVIEVCCELISYNKQIKRLDLRGTQFTDKAWLSLFRRIGDPKDYAYPLQEFLIDDRYGTLDLETIKKVGANLLFKLFYMRFNKLNKLTLSNFFPSQGCLKYFVVNDKEKKCILEELDLSDNSELGGEEDLLSLKKLIKASPKLRVLNLRNTNFQHDEIVSLMQFCSDENIEIEQLTIDIDLTNEFTVISVANVIALDQCSSLVLNDRSSCSNQAELSSEMKNSNSFWPIIEALNEHSTVLQSLTIPKTLQTQAFLESFNQCLDSNKTLCDLKFEMLSVKTRYSEYNKKKELKPPSPPSILAKRYNDLFPQMPYWFSSRPSFNPEIYQTIRNKLAANLQHQQLFSRRQFLCCARSNKRGMSLLPIQKLQQGGYKPLSMMIFKFAGIIDQEAKLTTSSSNNSTNSSASNTEQNAVTDTHKRAKF